jgi:hypothetical protein
MLVALGSGRCALPANTGAAAEIIPGLLRSDGDAEAGFGAWLPTAEHRALFAAVEGRPFLTDVASNQGGEEGFLIASGKRLSIQ